uniref:SHSP domain-containing protein n=1 Tax=Caenorhabditis tropicalis TaxID=1561998 RepID=A0A1I7UKE1_9PELO
MLLLRSPFSRNGCSMDQFFDEMTHGSLFPYWRDADHNSFNFSNTIGEIINDENKYAIQVDVSHFKPEDLKIEINGRELKIEGSQETKSEHGYSKRSFSKMVLLPEDVDLAALKSAISNDGKLQIEAPKRTSNNSRSIPINFVSKHQIQQS